MILKYINLVIILLFDGIIFGYPFIWINNFVMVEKYSFPTLNYIEGVSIIFLFKLIALLWKSVVFSTASTIMNKEENKEENG